MADKKEYIERGALLDFLKQEIEQCENDLAESCGDDRYEQAVDSRMTAFLEVLRRVERNPAADVVEVVHGYWKWETKIEPQAQNRLYCFVCDNECLAKGDYYEKSKYCPHCGAKMDGRKEQT